MATVQSRPRASSGVRIARAVSLASARSGVIQSRRVRALLSSRAERETPAAEGGRFPAAPGTVGGDAGSSVFDVFVGRDVDADALEARASDGFAELARAASASASSSGPPSAAKVL